MKRLIFLTKGTGRCLLSSLLIYLLLGIAGCGPSSASVSGKVFYRGQVVKGGMVTFYGENNWTGSSHIDKDGSYVISNVPSGTVKITVETKTAKPHPMMSKMPRPPSDAPIPPGSFYATDGHSDRYVSIPDHYADRDKSGLALEIKAGKQIHNIELK